MSDRRGWWTVPVTYAVACGFSIAFGVNVAADDWVGGGGSFIGAALFFAWATLRLFAEVSVDE